VQRKTALYKLANPCRTSLRTLFIQTQTTPNPRSLKFLTGNKMLDEGTEDFSTYKAAQRSPLASALFQVEGVTGVFLTAEFATVSINEIADWIVLKPQIFAAISDFFISGKPVMNEEKSTSDTAIGDDDDEVVAHIKELIETRIRPAVQEDGGDIKYVEMTPEGIVKLQLQGSCAGCPSSGSTLKNGIENMLMHYVPEVNGVEEWIGEEDLEQKAISDEALRKLEEGLAKVKK